MDMRPRKAAQKIVREWLKYHGAAIDVEMGANLAIRIEAELVRSNEAMGALLRQHPCNANTAVPVGTCVDEGACGCSCGLLLRKE